jgi:hypothetical protein
MKKIEFNKKQTKESDIKYSVVSTKLSTSQLNLFKAKAMEKNYSTSELLREIVLQYLDNDVCHENLLQSSMLKIMEKVDNLDAKHEFFEQLFYCWLAQWFLTHPKIEEDQKTIIKNSINRRNDFINSFIANVYNENEELYELLFANKVEEETE